MSLKQLFIKQAGLSNNPSSQAATSPTGQSDSFPISTKAIVVGIALFTWVATVPTPGYAFSLVLERDNLGANDQLDWGTLATTLPFTVLPPVFAAKTQAGLGVNVLVPPPTQAGITPPLVFQTGLPPTGIPTNFATGEFLLFTGFTPGAFPSPGNPGPLTILFETPVAAAGAQIAVDDTPSFNASIAAFDRNNTLLGLFSIPGTSSLILDNSAAFLGVQSDTPNIARVVFTTDVRDRAFAINTLSVNNSAVPEPTSLAAIALAGVGLLLGKRQRKGKV